LVPLLAKRLSLIAIRNRDLNSMIDPGDLFQQVVLSVNWLYRTREWIKKILKNLFGHNRKVMDQLRICEMAVCEQIAIFLNSVMKKRVN
jgi:hypothetical protein